MLIQPRQLLARRIVGHKGVVAPSSYVCTAVRFNGTANNNSTTTTAAGGGPSPTPLNVGPTAAAHIHSTSPRDNPSGYMSPEQARLSFETTSDPRKSPVAQLHAEVTRKRSSSVARTLNDDGTVTGIRSLRQMWMMIASIFFVIFVYLAVTKSDEANMARRHESIEKDIERERWRARELGLQSKDDGFADKYMVDLGKPIADGSVGEVAASKMVGLRRD